MNAIVENSNEMINSVLRPVTENTPAQLVLKLFVILYASLVAPKISSSFAPYINNMYFTILFLALIVWLFTKDPTMSILIAVGYYITISYLTQNSIIEVQQTGVVTPNVQKALNTSVVVPAPAPAKV